MIVANIDQDIANKVVVITGASSRLGEATARHLAAREAKLVFGARRVERLQALARTVAFAVSQPEYVDIDEILFRPAAQAL